MANQRRGQAFVQLRLFFMALNLAQVGDAVPQTPWDFSLYACSRQGQAKRRRAVSNPPALVLPVTSLQIGAQVASPQSPILRWSNPSLPITSGLTMHPGHYSPFDRTALSPFDRTTTRLQSKDTRNRAFPDLFGVPGFGSQRLGSSVGFGPADAHGAEEKGRPSPPACSLHGQWPRRIGFGSRPSYTLRGVSPG
jgi:hypothetical protein